MAAPFSTTVRLAVAACLVLAVSATASADVFKLASGGELRGELLNREEYPRKSYVIRTYTGVEIMLDADQVTDIDTQRDKEVEYERLKLRVPDTVESQMKLAEWCRERSLDRQREAHLRRVLELDHDHADARRMLGFIREDGRWMTPDQRWQEQGFVRYKGRWRLPQEVALLERAEKAEQEERGWYRRVKRYADNLGSSRDQEARAGLAAIDDVAAVPSLIEWMGKVENDRDKQLFAEVLVRLNTQMSVRAVVEASINDPSEDFRYACLDLIERHKPPTAAADYIKGLNPKWANELINRAAMGLERLADPKATGPLIDALVTTHKRQIGGGGGPDSISSSFGRDISGGGAGTSGLTTGGGPKVVTEHLRNEAVLKALVAITGEDFHFDIDAWKFWYARQNRVPNVIPGRRRGPNLE